MNLTNEFSQFMSENKFNETIKFISILEYKDEAYYALDAIYLPWNSLDLVVIKSILFDRILDTIAEYYDELIKFYSSVSIIVAKVTYNPSTLMVSIYLDRITEE